MGDPQQNSRHPLCVSVKGLPYGLSQIGVLNFVRILNKIVEKNPDCGFVINGCGQNWLGDFLKKCGLPVLSIREGTWDGTYSEGDRPMYPADFDKFAWMLNPHLDDWEGLRLVKECTQCGFCVIDDWVCVDYESSGFDEKNRRLLASDLSIGPLAKFRIAVVGTSDDSNIRGGGSKPFLWFLHNSGSDIEFCQMYEDAPPDHHPSEYEHVGSVRTTRDRNVGNGIIPEIEGKLQIQMILLQRKDLKPEERIEKFDDIYV